MIDHIGIRVSNLQKSKAFYISVFASINYQLLMEFPAAVTGTVDVTGFGEAPKPDFWISETADVISPVHVAFSVSSRDKVEAFYKAALEAGGRDNGAPGLWPHYHSNYYGAFILDLDGHNIEAVCHQPA